MMAAFQKFFYAIDTENTGVITSTDLRNYMQKMRYKESFVTTWTSLFDPEHTGIITYEKYCKVLGLNPAVEKSATTTESNIQQSEADTRPSEVEPIQSEPMQEKHAEQKFGHSDSGQEETDSKDPAVEKAPRKNNAESFTQPKKDTGKPQSRKRKHTDSPPKGDPNISIATKPASESVSDQKESEDSRMIEFDMSVEAKPQPMEMADEFGETNTVAHQKAKQITAGKSRSKPVKSESGKSEREAKYSEKSAPRKESGKSKMDSLEQESKSSEVHEDAGTDVFDLLVAAKSNPNQTIENFSTEEEEPPKSEAGTLAPKSIDNASATNPDSLVKEEVENSKKTKSRTVDKKRKGKASEKTRKEPANLTAELPNDSGVGVIELSMDTKIHSVELVNDFKEESLDTIVSKAADLTLAEKPSSLHEPTMESGKSTIVKPDKEFKDLSRKVSEKMEEESPTAMNIHFTKIEGQDLEVDIFDWLIETKDHPLETVDEDDVEFTSIPESDKAKAAGDNTESISENADEKSSRKVPENSETGELGIEHHGEQSRSIKESGHQRKHHSESAEAPSEELAQQPLRMPGEHEKGQKHEKQISQTSEGEGKKTRTPVITPPEESAKFDASRKKKESKVKKRDKKAAGLTGHAAEEEKATSPVEASANQPHSQRKSSDSFSDGLKESSGHDSSKMDVVIEPSTPAVIPDLTASEHLNLIVSGERPDNPSKSSITYSEQKKTSTDSENKPREMPPNPKLAHSERLPPGPGKKLEHSDVDVQEIVTSSVAESVNTEQLQLAKKPQMEIMPNPMEIEITHVITEPQESAKTSDTPIEKNKSPESGKASSKKASKCPGTDEEKPGKASSNINQKAEDSEKNSHSFETHQELSNTKKKRTDKKVKRDNKKSESKPSKEPSSGTGKRLKHSDVQEIVTPSVAESVNTEQLQLAKKPQMEIMPTPMEIEITHIITTPQESAKTPDAPMDTSTFNIRDPKGNMEGSSESGEKKNMKSSEAFPAEAVETSLLHVERVEPPKSSSSEKKKKMDDEVVFSKVTEQESAFPLVEHNLEKPEDLKPYHENEPSGSAQIEESKMEPTTVGVLESSVMQLEQESIGFPGTQRPLESSFVNVDIPDPSESLAESRSGKNNRRPKRSSKGNGLRVSESPNQKPVTTIQESELLVDKTQKDTSQKPPKAKKGQPRDMKKKESPQSKDSAIRIPAEQSDTNRADRKRTKKLSQKRAKPVGKPPEKLEAAPIMELNEGGLEILDRPPMESGSSEKKENNDSKKQKRKATSGHAGGPGKRSRKDEKKPRLKPERRKKTLKRRKRPQSVEKDGEIAIKKSAKRPRIGDLECGRFPRAFAVQVPHKVGQHRRDGAPVSTHALGKAPKGFTTKMSVERRNRDKPNKAIQRWKLRKSLRKVGTVVIMLAGRHKGKRAVVIGRHKFSGLLLVTGPFKLNGIPIRRVHPDYVIATKTIIKMDKIHLPGRMHTRQYFARQKPDNKLRAKAENLFVDPSANKKAYVLKEERKEDQKLIDKRVMAAIKQNKNAKMLCAYLRSLFSLSRTDKPHKMIF